MKTIEKINKAFDKLFKYKNTGYQPDNYSILLDRKDNMPVSDTNIKEFYTQQILSLIEEIESCLPKKKELPKPNDFIFTDGLNHFAIAKTFNSAVDQMRAIIKSYLKGVK